MMETDNMLKSIFNKCHVIYKGQEISQEYLMKQYIKYYSNTINVEKHNVGLVLHTGSICFDMISIFIAAISNVIFCKTNPEDIIETLRLGDVVLYGRTKKQRYIFGGFTKLENKTTEKYILLKQGGLESRIPEKMWSYIEPYCGESTRMDGRGIKKGSNKRIDFIESILNIKASQIPSISYVSSVIVMERQRVDDILNNLTIKYDEAKFISILDLTTASYFTEVDEYRYRGNPGKNEPSLKFVSKVSTAREIILNKNNNKTIGLTISGYDYILRGITEIPELMNYNALQYVYITCNIESDEIEDLIKETDNPYIFACTKEFLINIKSDIVIKNNLTEQLANQVGFIVNKKVLPIEVESNKSWEEFVELKKSLKSIKRAEFISSGKEYFVIHSYSLYNLFLTAIFSLQDMEQMIANNKINIESPKIQLDKLKTVANEFPMFIRQKAEFVIVQLEQWYHFLYEKSPKENAITNVFKRRGNERNALVIPKAYYERIIKADKTKFTGWNLNNLDIVTPNKFDNNIMYENVVVLGQTSSKRFDAFRCKSSSNIFVLIYDFERNIFLYGKKHAHKSEMFYNSFLEIAVEQDEPESQDVIEDMEQEVNSIDDIEKEMVDYINNIAITNIVEKGSVINGGYQSDVIAIGTFSGGEKVLFSKEYTAYVFDKENEDVYEVPVNKLEEGNILIFKSNNEITKDIIDDLLENLINEHVLDYDTKMQFQLSKRWKEVLRDYIKIHQATYREMAILLGKHGPQQSEQTLRSWLDYDSHIVGPRNIESLQQIALVTRDIDLNSNIDKYYEACSVIRKIRKKIRKMIGMSMIDKLRNKAPELGDDLMMKTISDHINDLAILLQLDSITEVNIQVSSSMINRPLLLYMEDLR